MPPQVKTRSRGAQLAEKTQINRLNGSAINAMVQRIAA